MTVSTHDRPAWTDDRSGTGSRDGGLSGGALVAVMKPADLGDCDDTPGWDRLYLAPAWAVATETLVRPRNVVVAEVRAKQATRVAFVEHDDEIEAFAANRADDALGEGILPGSARCNDDLANAHALDPALEVGAVDGIAIGEQVSGASLVRERVGDLLGGPRGRGLVGDTDVDEFSTVVAEHHEAEEWAKREGRYDEEINGRDLAPVSSQRGAPRRRRRTSGVGACIWRR